MQDAAPPFRIGIPIEYCDGLKEGLEPQKDPLTRLNN